MPAWGWISIAVVVVVAIAAVAVGVMRGRRTERLRGRFGPEYDRSVKTAGSQREAESELRARQERREQLDIRPLSPAARERYAQDWQAVQARFVDTPAEAIGQADMLVTSVMRERGYPIEDFEQRSADVSVDHPHVVENYRAAHGISLASTQGRATTEDMRQAMIHYRSLFEELLDDGTAGGTVDRAADTSTEQRIAEAR